MSPPRQVFKAALLASAAAVILAHDQQIRAERQYDNIADPDADDPDVYKPRGRRKAPAGQVRQTRRKCSCLQKVKAHEEQPRHIGSIVHRHAG